MQGTSGGALVARASIALDRFFPNRPALRIGARLLPVWTASARCFPLLVGAFATAGLRRSAFRSFALQGPVLAAALHQLVARAEPGSALHVRRVPVARPAFVDGAILTNSLATAIGSISVPRIENAIRLSFSWTGLGSRRSGRPCQSGEGMRR